jgi:hypothetical protein
VYLVCLDFDSLSDGARRAGLGVTLYGEQRFGEQRFPLVFLSSDEASDEASDEGSRTLLVTAGFHGDEPAGSLALVRHLTELAQAARACDVRLLLVPCVNPSGLAAGTRYNQAGERPNNDFLRYELSPGVWRGELRDGEQAINIVPSVAAAQETRALRALLDGMPAPDAALDLHQDPFLTGGFTYAYVFGDRARYWRIARHGIAPPLAGVRIASGYAGDHPGVVTDEDGLAELHDGSVSDYLWRRGCPAVACLETTTDLPPAQAIEVCLAWINGFLEIASPSPPDRLRV